VALCGRLRAGSGAPQDMYLDQLSASSLKTLLVASVFKQWGGPLVWVAPEPHVAEKAAHELGLLLSPSAVVRYPADEFSPYDLAQPDVASLRLHYQVLQRFSDAQPFILLLSPKNLLMKHPVRDTLARQTLCLKVGQEISPLALARQCQARGYVPESLVMDPGEFSSRGDLFDLYPVQGEPVRLSFFGDTIESIRLIDVHNQRSVQPVEAVSVIPRGSLVLSDGGSQRLLDGLEACYKQQAGRLDAQDAEGLRATLDNQRLALEESSGGGPAFWPDGIDYYAPLLSSHPEADFQPLLAALPKNTLLVLDDWTMLSQNVETLSLRLDRQWQEGVEKGRLLDLNGFRYHLPVETALSSLKTFFPRRLFLDTFALNAQDPAYQAGASASVAGTSSSEVVPMAAPMTFDVQGAERFKADMKAACQTWARLRRDGFQVYVTTDHPQRILDACQEWEVPAQYWPEATTPLAEAREQASWSSLDVILSKAGLADGFVLPREKIAHFTDTELFGRRLKRHLGGTKAASQRENLDVINAIEDLRQGDYVVHVKHGIGKFIEITRITLDGETREYLSVQYSGTDRLHVPVEQVHLLSRYRGAGDAPAKLSKMGGMEWSSVKKKVKKSIQNIAKDLMALYAARSRSRGFEFEPDSPWQVEMEEAFPYTETADQWQAIQDTKQDMESQKPMDRLICGDVGFGKTEVAVRALFKCVVSGRQAAFLCPTTILAQQHFNTLSERFAPYPVRMGLLSRFRSPKEQKEVVQRLGLGEVDIVVGTHRLLQKDVKFKDLGLVVIDEEQRFGVAHKEKLKHLRTEVDVLTLSATPIPRTLYMSLSGVREMSLINTPPANRSPIKTYVGPYNPAQIRMAILQEIDRGGQVYFVHNRVQTIYAKQSELQTLIPEARFIVGHGQMAEGQLENVMLDFAQRQYDVLLATTIIESGLDIPNVNTILIDRADRFGLAQLYQIRGRVGRSPVQAYAYCYYDPERVLSEDAKDRLRAIREFTTLGSGYQIALRDLEIRGVGNVLGSEQHGHMVAVGFDLYCQMLEESIEELKGNTVDKKEDAIIDLNVTALIPDDWVGGRDVKLREYKRLSLLETEKALAMIQAEWEDRFGPIPDPTKQLVNLVKLRLWATDLGIPLVRTDDEYLRIQVPFTLQEWMKYQAQLPPDIGKKARWAPAMATKQGALPMLLVKAVAMDGDDQVQYLMKLFQGLQKIRQSFMAVAG
jgi:transcription-repair coupling factor (superfamily II helicase)